MLGSHYNANSLGIAGIAAYLNQHGHDAWLYNADFLNEIDYANMREIFDGFSDYTEFFKNENDPIWQEVIEKIVESDANWVGYTSYTANISAINIISRKLKNQKPNIKQVIGGVHATLDHNVLDKLPAIDYSIQREGELAMLELVNGKSPKDIVGVVSREGVGLCNNGDAVVMPIDDLPFQKEKILWVKR